MASAEDPPDPNDNKKWNFKFNPFKILGLSSDDPEPEEVRKAYHSQIRGSHPDKAGQSKEALAKKLTAAYNYLKNADAEKLKDLAKSFGNPNQSNGLVNGDLSNVLVDKTKAEHYRRLFNAHVNVAKETHFKDNFQSFYKQVFDNVSAQPEVEYHNISPYHCHMCEEDFTHVEHHVEAVYFPFKEFVMSNAEPGFWEYLESVFDKESVNWTPAVTETSDWTREKFSSSLSKMCTNLKIVKDKQYTEEALGSFWSSLVSGAATIPVLSSLVSNRNETVETICTAVIQLIPKSSGVVDILDDDLIIPAFLKVEKDFKDWTKLALQVSSTCPRLAIILTCAGSSLEPEKEDKFYEIGLNIIKFQNGFNYAHLCFLLGSCDLNFVADKILTISSHIECQRLAASYMLTNKMDGLTNLETLGEKAVRARKIHLASTFYLALIRHHFKMGDGDSVVRALAKILPSNKLWRAVQALVADNPELALNCEAVAEITIVKILKDWGETQASLMESILGAILGLKLSTSSTVSVLSILTLCGALHNLYGDEERYEKASKMVLQRIESLLDAKLVGGDAEFIVALVRIPGILPVIKDILEHKQFLGRNSAKPQPGSSYHACLLVLRGIYHYKTKRFTEMVSDFASAAMNTNKKIASAIATFVSSNPMIHERILRGATRKFEQVQTYIDDYTGEPLEYSNFVELFQHTFANEEPYLSACYSVTSKNGGPDLKALEKDILGRGEDEDDAEEEHGRNQEEASAADFAEKAYNYVNLEVICKGTQETICCLTQSAHYFYKAMLATCDENIPEKFGYLGLILECCTNQLRHYANIVMLPPSTALHSLRATLSFIFQANQHFSQILRKNRQHNGHVNFIDEGGIKQQTNDWQMLLNIRTICPIIVPDIFTIAEGRFALQFLQNLSYSMIKGKIQSGLYSHNTPEFLYHHMLFNGVWNECLSPEETEYEEPIPDTGPLMLQIEKIDNEKDSEEEKARKAKKNEEILTEKERLEQLQRELEETPLVDRMGFKLSRENAVIVLAELYGYGIEEVETMMNWNRIRRTADGFIDTGNRTLNFDGEQAYTKFLGIQMNPNTQTCTLLMEPAVAGDPQKPALFSSVDLLEIFGNKILAGFVSFDEMILPPGTVPDYLRLLIPFHPFFKVKFAGIGPEGANKESICGTNFLMTLYHLDLLAKIFTTGQEVGANFPFSFLDTETNLLSSLSRELQEILKPIGPRKKARLLRRLECIHRFWFSVEDVEQEIVQATQQNGGTSSIKYGDVSLVLKTMPMIRNESGELVDAENEFDEDSPEVKFVRGFNEKMHLIEKEFPIIQRIKELAKISSCLSILLGNKANLEKDIPTVKDILSVQLPPTRPYSKCGPLGQPCNCCDWVPAVYHYMKVTDEQKLEYLFEKRFGRKIDPAISPEEQMRRLGFHEQPEQDGTNHGSSGVGPEESTKSDANKNQNEEAGASKPTLDIGQYDRLEEYRCYGGVTFQPSSKSITGIPQPSNPQSYVNWRNVVDAGLLAAQFVPATAIPAAVARGVRVISFLNSAAKIGGGRSGGGVTGNKGPCGSVGGGGGKGGGSGAGGGGGGKGGGGGGKGGGGSGKGGGGGGGSGSGSGKGGGSGSSGGGSSGSSGGSGTSGGTGSSGNASNTGRGGGPKVELPKGPGQTKHIFRDKKGHFKNEGPNGQNEKLLEDVANNGKIHGTDSRGNTWADKIQGDGSQVWVKFRGNKIQNGGINAAGEHRTFNPETGFDSPVKPGQK